MPTNNLISSGGRLRKRSNNNLATGRGLCVHTSWFSFSQTTFNQWAAEGVELIRLMFWPRDLETAANTYNQTNLNYIHTSIQRAAAAGIDVVLCPLINSPVWGTNGAEALLRLPNHWLNSSTTPTGPATPFGEFSTASHFDVFTSHGQNYVTKILTEFRDYASVVGFDGCNEPDLPSASKVARGVERQLAWYRAADNGTEKLYFVATTIYSSQDAASTDCDWSAITDWTRVVLQLHVYFAPQSGGDDGFEAIARRLRDSAAGTFWNGSSEATAYTTSSVNAASSFALHFAGFKALAASKGVPWGIGESGVQYFKTTAPERLAWAQHVRDAAIAADAAFFWGWIGADYLTQDDWSSNGNAQGATQFLRPEYAALMAFAPTEPTGSTGSTSSSSIGGAVPTVVGVGAIGVTPNSATASMTATGATLPSGVVAGDLLLMFCGFDTGATTTGLGISTPSGWGDFGVEVSSWPNSVLSTVFFKVAVGGDSVPSPTFTGATTGTTTGGVAQIQVMALRGVDTSSLPTSALAGGNTGNLHSGQQNIGNITGYTPTSPDVLHVLYATKKDDWTSIATPSPTDGLTWTNRIAASTTNSSDAAMVVSTAPMSGAAIAISAKQWIVTGGAAATSVSRAFALKGSTGTAWVRTQGEALGITDSVTPNLQVGGSALTQSVNDSAGVTDATTRALGSARILADTANVSDAPSTSTGYQKSVSDAAGITDGVTPSLTVSSLPKASTLVEDFGDGVVDLAKWRPYGTPDPVEFNGILEVPCTSGYNGYTSVDRFDLIGSSYSIEIVGSPSIGNGSTEQYLYVSTDIGGPASNWHTFNLKNGNLEFLERVGGVDSATTSIVHDPVAHRWWRIAESGGNVLWQTSPSGLPGTWVTRRSKVPSVDLSSTIVDFGTGYLDTEAGPGSAMFDNVNIVKFVSAIGDTATITDSITFTLVRAFSLSDTASITDTQTPSEGLVRSIADTSNVTDGITPSSAFQRSLADTSSITDSLSSAMGLGRVIPDTAGVTDSASADRGIVSSLSDIAGITDQALTATGVGLNLSDNAGITDQLTPVQGLVRILSDTGVLTDLPSTAAAYLRTLSDTADITDSSVVLRVLALVLTDTASISDNLQTAQTIIRAVDDVAGVTDSPSLSAGYFRSLSDTVSVTDQMTAAILILLGLTDTASITDQSSSASTKQLTISDSATLQDVTALVSGWSLLLADGAVLTDSNLSAVGLSRALSDTAQITDSAVSALGLGRVLSDSASIQDTLVGSLALARALSDLAQVTDFIDTDLIIQGVLTHEINDGISITDSVQRTSQIVRILSDLAAVSDDLVTAATKLLLLSDGATLSDAVSPASELQRLIEDAATLSDLLISGLETFLELSDSAEITDELVQSQSRLIVVTDDLIVVDSASTDVDQVIAQALSMSTRDRSLIRLIEAHREALGLVVKDKRST